MAGRIGQMNQRVAIKQLAETTDVGPGKTVAWSTLDTVWAQVEPVNADEQIQGQGQASTADYRVRLRYRSDLTPAHRLLWDGKTLQILGVLLEGGAKRYLNLRCGEIA